MKMKTCQDCSFDTIGVSAPFDVISKWKFCPVCSGDLEESNRYEVEKSGGQEIPINKDSNDETTVVDEEIERLRESMSEDID